MRAVHLGALDFNRKSSKLQIVATLLLEIDETKTLQRDGIVARASNSTNRTVTKTLKVTAVVTQQSLFDPKTRTPYSATPVSLLHEER